jgi:glycine cleavage system H protein
LEDNVNIPVELRYTNEHEWVRVEENIAIVGITDYAQSELGDIVFVELPSVGKEVKQMEPFGTIEAVKAVSDLFSPVTGKVIEVNSALDNDPMVINRDPYGEGWIIKVELSDRSEVDELLDSTSYKDVIGE